MNYLQDYSYLCRQYIEAMIEIRSIASNVKPIYSSKFDENGYYICLESEYNDNFIDTRTVFYGVSVCSYSEL